MLLLTRRDILFLLDWFPATSCRRGGAARTARVLAPAVSADHVRRLAKPSERVRTTAKRLCGLRLDHLVIELARLRQRQPLAREEDEAEPDAEHRLDHLQA